VVIEQLIIVCGKLREPDLPLSLFALLGSPLSSDFSMKCMTQVEKPETLEKVLLIQSDSLYQEEGVGRLLKINLNLCGLQF
jgi:hypothetical protein